MTKDHLQISLDIFRNDLGFSIRNAKPSEIKRLQNDLRALIYTLGTHLQPKRLAKRAEQ